MPHVLPVVRSLFLLYCNTVSKFGNVFNPPSLYSLPQVCPGFTDVKIALLDPSQKGGGADRLQQTPCREYGPTHYTALAGRAISEVSLL